MARRYDILMRLLLVGDTGVGKTCLLCRYANDEFFDTHISTIGIDFKMKTVIVEGKVVKVQIWDTAGQERFESITKQFYRRAEGIMLVYDITNKNSFEGVEKWISYIRQLTREDPVMMLLGNKTDRQHRRKVPYDMAEQFAQNNHMKYWEASAKNANNIDQAFMEIIRDVMKSSNCVKQSNGGVDKSSTGGGVTVHNDRLPLLPRPSRSDSKDEESVQEAGSSKWSCCSVS